MATDRWRQVKICDVAAPERNALVGGPFGSNLVSSDYVDSGIPVIRGQNMGDRWVGGEFVYVTRDKATSLSPNIACPGDLVFTQRGTLGQVALIPPGPFERYLISQSQMKLTADHTIADPLFLYYQFKSPEQQEYVRRNAIQTGVPHTNLGILRDTPIVLPPLIEQQAIACILGALDDKIELNRRMNQTLEGIARAIFKSWFVDFDPVRANAQRRGAEAQRRKEKQREDSAALRLGGSALNVDITELFPDEFVESEVGEIPEGWTVQGLSEIGTFLNGLALQKYPPINGQSLPVIKIAQLRKGNTDGADQASIEIDPVYVVDDGDVIFSWSGSLECVLWTGGRGALNQHLFKVTSDSYPKWFYYFWIHYHLPWFRHIAEGKATTMGHIQRHHLTEAKVLTPSTSLLDAMDRVLSPIVNSIIPHSLESRSLVALRDTLLPKLISGALCVPDAEQIVRRQV
jgi:type I restriction enzyme S subunit